MAIDQETIRLILDMGASGKNVRDVVGELQKLETEANRAGKSTGNLGQAALQAGRAFQDLSQGGFAGVLNNIESVVTSLGGSVGLAGVISGLGVAAYLAYPHVKDLLKLIGDGSDYIPDTTRDLSGLNDEIERNAAAEKLANEQRERRNALDAVRKAAAGGDKEAGEIATAAINEAGGVDKVQAELTEMLAKQSAVLDGASKRLERAWAEKAVADQAKQGIHPGDFMAMEQANKRLRAANMEVGAASTAVGQARAGVATRAEDLLARASRGDQAAIAELARRFPGSAFGQATPDAMAAANQEADATIAATEMSPETKRRRSAKREEAARNQKLADAINDVVDRPAAKAQIDSAVADLEREANGGLTLDERGLQARTGVAVDRAYSGKGNVGEIERLVRENEAALQGIDDAGGFGSAAYQAFLQTSAQLRRALGMLKQAQFIEDQFRQDGQVSPTRIPRGR